MAVVVNIVDPDAIVFGGGLSNIDGLYRDVPGRWGDWVFSDRVDTRLCRAHHGDSSGVRGARGHASGELWTADGRHVATVAQEVLLRVTG